MKANKLALGSMALLVVALLLLPAKSGRAEGFESIILDGTNSIGDASIRTPNYFGINPTEGTHQLLLTTINNGAGSDPIITGNPPNQSGNNAVSVTNLAAFLGINTSNIRDGTVTGQEGSAFKLNLGLLSVGDVITFNYNFLTNDAAPPDGHNDFAFVSLSLIGGNTPVIADELAPPQFVTTGAGNPFVLETHYQTYSITITQAGNYTLGIGIVDGTTNDNTSALLVDNISVIPVPEPSTVGLAVAGAALLVALRSRFRRA